MSATLKDLAPGEKRKVARLIRQVVEKEAKIRELQERAAATGSAGASAAKSQQLADQNTELARENTRCWCAWAAFGSNVQRSTSLAALQSTHSSFTCTPVALRPSRCIPTQPARQAYPRVRPAARIPAQVPGAGCHDTGGGGSRVTAHNTQLARCSCRQPGPSSAAPGSSDGSAGCWRCQL